MRIKGLDKIIAGVGNTRQENGYGGKGLDVLVRDGYVTTDPEWSGCLTLTPKGWDRYFRIYGISEDES